MTVDTRYQVFISTTYPDLLQARQALTLPMLDLGLLPVGFDTRGEVGATLPKAVQKLIDECDYYVLLLGGRYGNLSPLGLSEIHREYIYAATKRKPMVAFIHDTPALLPDEQREIGKEGQVRRDDFARLIETKTTSFRWSSEQGLTDLVARVMPDVMRQHRALGWVRAGQAGGGADKGEVQQLTQRIETLEKELEESLSQSRPPLKTLARGADKVILSYSCNVYEGGDCKVALAQTRVSWDQAFACVAPLMLNPASEPVMQKALEDFIGRQALEDVQSEFPKAHAVRNVVLASHAFNQIKVHLRALGLIIKTAEQDSRGMPLWRLTAHGDNTMSQIMAVRRSVTL